MKLKNNTGRLAAGLCGIVLVAALQGCGSGDEARAEKHYRKALEYQQAGEQRAAMIEWKNLLTVVPDHAEGRMQLGLLYLEMEEGAAAEKELRRAQELGRESAEITRGIVRALVQQRKYEEALKLLTEAGSGDESSDAYTLEGMARFGLEQWQQAEQSFGKALEQDTDNHEARLGLVRVALRRNRVEEAEKHLNVVLEAEPENTDALFLKGKIAYVHHDYVGARDAFSAVLKYDREDMLARLELADVLVVLNELDAADKQIDVLFKQARDNPMVNYVRARAAYRRQDLEGAANALHKVLGVIPNHPGSLIMLGTIQFQLGLLEQAAQSFRHFVNLNPDSLEGRKKLAAVYIRLGKAKDALEILQPVMSGADKDPQLLILAANSYIANEDFEEANSYLERAAGVAPQMMAVRTQLALNAVAAGEVDKAIETLKKALEEDPDAPGAALALARIYLKRQDYDNALQVARAYAERNPKNPEPYYLEALAFQGSGKTGDARAWFEKTLEVDPRYTPAALALAGMDLAEGDTEAARKRYENILAYDTNQPQVLVALARMLADNGEADEEAGLALVEQARRHNPDTLEPRLILIDYYLRKHDVNAALEVIEEVKKLEPGDARTLTTLGMAQNLAGDYPGAVATFRRLIELDPASYEAHFQLALAHEQLGNRALARAALKKAIELKPDYLMAVHALGEMELGAGNIEAARELAARIRKAKPGLAAGYALEGDAYFAQKDYKAAIAAYREAMNRGWSSQGVLKLYQAHLLVGNPDAARSVLLEWLANNPNDVSARLALAENYRKRGKVGRAKKQYEKILELQPHNFALLNNIAWIYHEAGDDKALELAARAYRLAPDRPAVMDTYGWLLVQAGKTSEGLALLETAFNRAPDNADIHYHYATALARSGEPDSAREELERLLETGGEFSERDKASALLQRLR